MEKTQKVESLFPSFRQTMELLDCSKFYLNKLIKKKVIKRYYIEKDESGKPTGKPYFNRQEIEQAFFKEAS